jgi:serine/threonine protein kinase
MPPQAGSCLKCGEGATDVTAPCQRCNYKRPIALDQRPINGKWKVVKRLGGGGMAEVFLVQNHLVDTIQRALKLIIPEKDDDMYRQRFLKEAQVAARVKGKHIAQLHDYDVCDDGTPFATWEYIEGQTLAEIVNGTPLSVHRALRLMEQITDGLGEIHRDAIHRDIKLANLMIRADALGSDKEELVILDFGLAKPRDEKNSRYRGQPVMPGTPRYMAPELFEGRDVDPSPAQDIYAAGIVMFEILVGVPPYRPVDLKELLAMIEKGPEWRGILHTDLQLQAIVKRSMEKDPAKRFADAQEFGAAVREVLKSLDANAGNDPVAVKAVISVNSPSRQPPPTPPTKNEPITPALNDFRTAMKKHDATIKEVPGDAEVDPARVRIPKFMLFNRAGHVVLAIVGQETEVNPAALQKTNEPQTEAVFLKRPELRALGFVEGHVHPIFRDPSGRVTRILVDAMILAQAEFFPESLIMFPMPEGGGSMIVPCYAAMTALRDLHGARLVYANIARRHKVNADGSLSKRRSRERWTNDPLLSFLLAQHPVKTRFAPTPSGPLHIGNARTALASYLLYRRGRKDHRGAQFHIRIDDTDLDKSRDEFVDRILNDVRTLGIHTDQYPVFRQNDMERYNTFYAPLWRILLLARLASYRDSGNLMLHPRWNDNYHNFWLDWRDGPTVEHTPPVSDPHTEWEDAAAAPTTPTRPAQRVEKYIALVRPSGGLPFYRFAGLGDDMLPFAEPHTRLNDVQPITYVVRDNKQRADLTKVQSHIRAGIEEARTQLADDPHAQEIFRNIGLDHRLPIPVPIYLHVPFVVSANGAKLSKSAPEDQYLVATMIEDGILQETIVAYLIWTMVPVLRTGRQSLDEIAGFTGRHGVECAIARFAEELDRSFLTDTCEQPISCDLHLLRKANVVTIRAMLPWGFRLRLEETTPGNELSASYHAVWKLYEHRQFFANWNQVVAVARGPIDAHSIDPITRQVCRKVMQETDPVAAMNVEVAAARLEVKNSRRAGGSAPSATALLRDLRLLLTGAQHSAGIHQILSMLHRDVVMSRIRKAEEWTTM